MRDPRRRRGTRISEESHLRPKPMIEIGGRPILWHIMKIYAHHGVTDFVICLGYRGYMIKEYFANYFLHNSDVTIDVAANAVDYHDSRAEPWRVTLVDTGDDDADRRTSAASARAYLDADEPFFLTYGDGLADVDIAAQLAFHEAHGALGTMTVVRPPARFGNIRRRGRPSRRLRGEAAGARAADQRRLLRRLDRRRCDYIDGDDTPWETEPLQSLDRRRSAAGVAPRRLLAADGHAPREGAARVAVGAAEMHRGSPRGSER